MIKPTSDAGDTVVGSSRAGDRPSRPSSTILSPSTEAHAPGRDRLEALERWARPGRDRQHELDELLANFSARGRGMTQTLRDSAREIGASLATLAITHSLTLLTSRRYASSEAGALMGNLGLLSLVNLMGSEVSRVAGKIIRDCSSEQKENSRDKMRLVFEVLRERYAAEAKGLPHPLQHALAFNALQVEASISKDNILEAEVALRIRQQILLSMPLRPVDVSGGYFSAHPTDDLHLSSDPESCVAVAINDGIRALLAEYPQEVRPTLSAFVAQVRANSRAQLARPRPAQIYLEGPPGTGKTRFAQRLAEVLHLPLCLVSCEKNHFDLLFDGPMYGEGSSIFNEKPADALERNLGQVPAAVVASGVANPVVVLDEFGAFFTESAPDAKLLAIANGDALAVRLRLCDNLNLDLSRCAMVMTGNAPMTDAALASRLKRVRFDRLDVSQKRTAVGSALDQELSRMKGIMGPKTQALYDTRHRVVDKIVEIDAELELPGVRAGLRVAREVVCLHLSADMTGEPLADREVEQFIRTALQQRLAAEKEKEKSDHKGPR